MREIKFEWVFKHPESEEIKRKVYTLDDLLEMFDYQDLQGDAVACDCQSIGETNVVECGCDDYLEEFELIAKRQYAGLKDKCGQEIYEDDALGLWGDGEYMLLGFVGYGSQENIFAGMFALFDKDDHMNDFTLEDYAKPENWDHLEVIGNRYENPELLKAENEI